MAAHHQRPRVLLAHNERVARETLARDLSAKGYAVRATASFDTLWRWVRAGEGDLVLIDVDISDPARNGFELLKQIRETSSHLPTLVLSAENTVLTSLLAARFGAFDYFPKPFNFEHLSASIARALQDVGPEQKHREPRTNLPLTGSSAPMQAIYRRIAQAAQSTLALLVTGQTGTGKSLVATVVHDYGKGSKEAFVVLHFPLGEAGFEKAVAKAIAQAKGGTLLLDEISALTSSQQALLVAKISCLETQKSAPRLITTMRTPGLVGTEMRAVPDALRYRLNTLHIDLPPLRERGEDSVELADFFVTKFSQCRQTLSAGARKSIAGKYWPGNVRELRNLIERAVLMARSDVINTEDIMPTPQGPAQGRQQPEQAHGFGKALEQVLHPYLSEIENSPPPPKNLYAHVLGALEKPLLKQVMAMTNQNQLKAAKHLGINRNTLHKKLLHFGLISPQK